MSVTPARWCRILVAQSTLLSRVSVPRPVWRHNTLFNIEINSSPSLFHLLYFFFYFIYSWAKLLFVQTEHRLYMLLCVYSSGLFVCGFWVSVETEKTTLYWGDRNSNRTHCTVSWGQVCPQWTSILLVNNTQIKSLSYNFIHSIFIFKFVGCIFYFIFNLKKRQKFFGVKYIKSNLVLVNFCFVFILAYFIYLFIYFDVHKVRDCTINLWHKSRENLRYFFFFLDFTSRKDFSDGEWWIRRTYLYFLFFSRFFFLPFLPRFSHFKNNEFYFALLSFFAIFLFYSFLYNLDLLNFTFFIFFFLIRCSWAFWVSSFQ